MYRSRDRRARRLDLPGAALATTGLFALVYAIIQGQDAGWSSPLIVGSFGAAAALLAGFVAVERRSQAPMLPLGFFRRAAVTGPVLMIALIFFAQAATVFFFMQFLQLVQGRDALEAGLFVVPSSLAVVLGAGFAGGRGKAAGPKLLVVLAGLTMAVALAILSTLEVDTAPQTLLVALVLFGLGGGLALAPLTDVLMAAVPLDDAGIGSALNDVSRQLGASLGIAALGSAGSTSYRGSVETAFDGQFPRAVVDASSGSIGAAVASSHSLPAEAATVLVAAANAAFVDALSGGLMAAVFVLTAAVLVAAALVPRRAQIEQIEQTAGDRLKRQPAAAAGAVTSE